MRQGEGLAIWRCRATGFGLVGMTALVTALVYPHLYYTGSRW